MDLSPGLNDCHVLVTGGAGHIGSAVISAFLSAGARVTCLDVSEEAITRLKKIIASKAELYPEPLHLWSDVVDISDEDAMEKAFEKAETALGPVRTCIALAAMDLSVLHHHASIVDMPSSQFRRTLDVNVYGTFLTARTWLRRLKEHNTKQLSNRSLVIVGSESGLFGERQNADYATSKSAVQGGLLQSLKADVPRICPGARCNAIAPGPVDTAQFRKECQENPDQYWADAQGTTALGKPVDADCVARSILYLSSDKWSGSVHGIVLQVDSGKQGKVQWDKGEYTA